MTDANNVLLFFIFQGHAIRVVIHDNEPWFVAKDVCDVLDISNVSQTINGNPSRNETGLDEDETHIYQVNTSGGPRATLCINEPNLYRLTGKSRMLGAKTFGLWARRDVIASLPKHQKDEVGISDSISGKQDIPIRYVVGKKLAAL